MPPLLYRIESPGVKWVTFENPEQTQGDTSPDTLFLNSLHHVVGAGGVKPACRRNVGRQEYLVYLKHEKCDLFHAPTATVIRVCSSLLTRSHRGPGGILITLTE